MEYKQPVWLQTEKIKLEDVTDDQLKQWEAQLCDINTENGNRYIEAMKTHCRLVFEAAALYGAKSTIYRQARRAIVEKPPDCTRAFTKFVQQVQAACREEALPPQEFAVQPDDDAAE